MRQPKLVNIFSPDGDFKGYITGDDAPPRPGVVLLQEIFGVNNAIRLACDQFAADGFIVLAPDLFHQVRPGIELGNSDSDRDTAIGIWQGLDDEHVRRDVAASIAALRQHPTCTGQVAVVGFCLGGKHALLAAIDGIVDAAVSFYPVQVLTYQDRLKALQCPVQVQIGDVDTHVPPEVQAVLAAAMTPPNHEYHLHPGAGHGFYNSIRSFGFHPQAAANAHRQAVDFVKAAVGKVAQTAPSTAA